MSVSMFLCRSLISPHQTPTHPHIIYHPLLSLLLSSLSPSLSPYPLSLPLPHSLFSTRQLLKFMFGIKVHGGSTVSLSLFPSVRTTSVYCIWVSHICLYTERL